MAYADDSGYKYLTVAQLKRMLAQLPDHYTLAPNQVGNLRVGDAERAYKGFIDFVGDGEYQGE